MTDAPEIKQNANGVWFLEGEQLWDSDLLPIILEHINPGDTVIDAGAWIGGHTMAYAKKVGLKGMVHAFEPNTFAFECLTLNAAKFPNILYTNVALGDKREEVFLSAKTGWFDSGYIGNDEKLSGAMMEMIDGFKLSPNFIKIDVEGCELKVLKGAAKTIEKHRPKLVVEVNELALNRQGHTTQEVWAWLVEHRYGVDPIEKVTHDAPIYNVLAIPR